MSEPPRCSTSMPSKKRSVQAAVKEARLLVGGYQSTPPPSTPRSVQRVVTVSPCTLCSSTETRRSGKVGRRLLTERLNPCGPWRRPRWLKNPSATTSAITENRRKARLLFRLALPEPADRPKQEDERQQQRQADLLQGPRRTGLLAATAIPRPLPWSKSIPIGDRPLRAIRLSHARKVRLRSATLELPLRRSNGRCGL